jgi:tRNA (cytosine38-C5)-methyltransferase
MKMATLGSPPLQIVEFYCGIGGWHYAMKETGMNLVVLGAYDINTTANQVYRHNFPTTKHHQRNISGLSAEELDSLAADVFTISPPCQPFTRQGKQEDMADHRTDSFFHLMQVISNMSKPPSYIMMENVRGFEASQTRHSFVDVLHNKGYSIQEFLISPKQFGVPNSRLRYYLLGYLQSLNFQDKSSEAPHEDIDILFPHVPKRFLDDKLGQARSISDYLETNLSEEMLKLFLVPDGVLSKYGMGFDIVTCNSYSSCCFTRSYYHYTIGTGSILHHNLSVDLKSAFENYQKSQNDKEGTKHLKELQLRYFTPREVANLMCFPPAHSFPPNITMGQQYKLLGNSVNVLVVGTLLNYLLNNC